MRKITNLLYYQIYIENKKLIEENKNLKQEIEKLRNLLDLLGGDD